MPRTRKGSKRALSWLLALALALSALPAAPAFAANEGPNAAITQGGLRMDAPDGGYSMFSSPAITVSPGTTYTLGAWITGTGNVCLTAVKSDRSTPYYYVDHANDDSQWVYFEYSFTATESIMYIFLENDSGQPGTRYIYGVTLKETGGDGAELLPNQGDFTSWSGYAGYTPLTAAELQALDAAAATPNDFGFIFTKDGFKAQSATDDWNSGGVYYGAPGTYTYSAWVKVEAGSLTISGLDTWTATGSVTVSKADGWQYVEFDFDTTTWDIRIPSIFEQNVGGTAYVYNPTLVSKDTGDVITPWAYEPTGTRFPMNADTFNVLFCTVPIPGKTATGIDVGAAGDIWLNNIPVTPGDEYVFSGWVYTEPFPDGTDVNPHLLTYDPGNPNAKYDNPAAGLVVDHWEWVNQSGWKYVYVNGFPPTGVDNGYPGGSPGHTSRFIAYGNSVNLEIRYKASAVQYFYDVRLFDVTTGKTVVSGIQDFTPRASNMRQITAQEMNDLFFWASPPTHVPVDGITGIPASVHAGKLKLTATVTPSNATNSAIVWSVKDAGATGAWLSGNILNTSAEGTVVLTATVAGGGATAGEDFVKDFSISITSTAAGAENPNYSITKPGIRGGGGRGALFYTFKTEKDHTYVAGAWVRGGGQPWLSVRNDANMTPGTDWVPTVTGDWPADPNVWTWVEVEITNPYGGWIEYKWDCGYMGGETEFTYFYGMSMKDKETGEEIITQEYAAAESWTRWTMSGGWADAGQPPTEHDGMFITVSAADLKAMFPPKQSDFGNDPNYSITKPGIRGGGGRGALFYTFKTEKDHTYVAGAWVRGGGQPWLSVRNDANMTPGTDWVPTVTGDWPADPDVWTWVEVEITNPYGGWIEYKWDCGYMGGETEFTYFYGMSMKDKETGEEIITQEYAAAESWTRWTMSGGWADAGQPPTEHDGMFITIPADQLAAMFPPKADPNVLIDKPGIRGGGGRGALFYTFKTEKDHTYVAGAWVRGGGQPWLSVRNDANMTPGTDWVPTVTGDWPADPNVWTWVEVEITNPYGGWIEYKWDCGYMGGETEFTYFYGMSMKDKETGEAIITQEYAAAESWTRWTMSGGWAEPGDPPTEHDGMFITIPADQLAAMFPPTGPKDHKPVTNITNVRSKVMVGDFTLDATVVPDDASVKNIVWTVRDPGTTGATIEGNVLSTAGAGVVLLTATIPGGGKDKQDFVKYFKVEVTLTDPDYRDPQKPYIVQIPFLQQPNGVGSIYGGQFSKNGGDAEVAIQPLTGFTGAPDPETAEYRITPFKTLDNMIQYEIPADIAYDVWALWVKNDAGNWSDVRIVNRAEIDWVNEHFVYPGQKLVIMGRNVVNPLNRSADNAAVRFAPTDGGVALYGEVYDMTDYSVYFRAPSDLEAGKQYNIEYTNGAGGGYGWTGMLNAERETVTGVALDDNIRYFDGLFNLNMAYVSSIDTGNIVNIKDAVATWQDGAANDAAAAVEAALASMGPGGGVLYFPAGEYIIDRITLPNNVALVGDGKGKSVLNWRGTAGKPGSPLIQSNATTVGIFGLSLVNGYDRFDYGMDSTLIKNMVALSNSAVSNEWVGGYAMKDVEILNSDGGGVYMGGPRPAAIDDCYIKVNVYSAVELTNGLKNPRIRNSYLFNRLSATIFNTCDFLFIENTTIEGDCLKWEAEQYALYCYDNGIPDPGSKWSEVDHIRHNGNIGTEHRPMDTTGEEMLFLGNTVLGLYGGEVDNAGEGICNQTRQETDLYAPAVSATARTLVTGKDLGTAISTDAGYVQILGGPGIGQVRKIVGYDQEDNGTIYVDEPWDIVPTNQSVYAILRTLIARDVFANNVFNAKMSKGDIVWYKSFEDVIANNQFIGAGGGIWMQSGGGGSFDHYYLTVYNNYFSDRTDHFLPALQKVLVHCSDGGVALGGTTYGDTIVYGMQIVHNEMHGVATTASPRLDDKGRNVLALMRTLVNPGWGLTESVVQDYINRFALRSGLFIAESGAVAQPVSWGTVVDGNKVSNQVNGFMTGNRAWDTVMRNNDFSGNGADYVRYDEAVRTTELGGGSGAPGVTDLGPIRLPGSVDRTGLAEALAEAAGVNRSLYKENTVSAFDIAYSAGSAVYADANASQAEVDAAAGALVAAISNLAKAEFTCPVKSMLAKVAKPQAIPYTWDGVGTPAFATSNAAVCGVTQDGKLVPMKAGIAVITVTAPNGTKIVFAVTVTV